MSERPRVGDPPRRTRRLRAFALSTLGIRDTDRNAPQYKPRLGRSSRRRAGLPPSAAHTAYSNYATISTLLLRRSGHVLCAKSSERKHTCRPAQRKILQTTPLPKQPQVPKQQRGRLELHLFPARRGCARRREAQARRSPCRRDERPKRGPHRDASRAVSRIPSAKNS